jgi:hypothetical protein
MGGILLPGWNLAGRLPSVSKLKGDGGYVVMVRKLEMNPGQLLRVPRVIALVNGSHDDPGEFSRIGGVIGAVFRRISSAMPDAILLPVPNVVQDPNNQVEAISFLPWTFIPEDTPVIGCDFMEVYVGSGSASENLFGSTLDAVVAQQTGFTRYTVRIFELSSEPDPGKIPIGDVVDAAAAMGIDIEMEGQTQDATEDSISAIISDHFGVTI